MNRGLDKLASLTQAQWEEILKCRSHVILQLFSSISQTSSDNYPNFYHSQIHSAYCRVYVLQYTLMHTHFLM